MSKEKTRFQGIGIPASVRLQINKWIWPACLGIAVIGLLFSGLAPRAKGRAVISVAGWGWLGRRAGVLAPILMVLLIAMGWIDAFEDQTAVLGAIVLGQGGWILRLMRPGRWEAALAGLLWAGMAFLLPGLAPLALLGLLALASMREDYERTLVFSGWGALLAGLAFVVTNQQVPAALLRPVDVETYDALMVLFRDLFAVESLWTVIPLVGLFELAQGYPQDGRVFRRNLPVLGGVLCLLFLPTETLRGGLFTLGLPVAAVMLSRWLLAFPQVRKPCASRLAPTLNPLPDNFWLTSLTTVLAGVFLWGGWTMGSELFQSGEPVTLIEAHLLSGEGGHPLSLALMSLSEQTEMGLLFWNRLVSGAFLVASAALLCWILNRIVGAPLALCAGILFLSLPGFAIRLSSAGGGAVALWFFLKAFSSLGKENAHHSWLRGGIYAGVAFWLNPVWFFPCLGLMAGVFEVHRLRLGKFLIGLGLSFGLGLVVMLAVQPAWFITLAPSVLSPDVRLDAVGGLLRRRYLFLSVACFLILLFGVRRRGMGWWCLSTALVPFIFANRLGIDPANNFIPVALMSCIAFVRLPMVMDVRHPSPYQSLLTCQLLLWVPVLIGMQEMVIFLR